jgi:hypothetical protein
LVLRDFLVFFIFFPLLEELVQQTRAEGGGTLLSELYTGDPAMDAQLTPRDAKRQSIPPESRSETENSAHKHRGKLKKARKNRSPQCRNGHKQEGAVKRERAEDVIVVAEERKKPTPQQGGGEQAGQAAGAPMDLVTLLRNLSGGNFGGAHFSIENLHIHLGK